MEAFVVTKYKAPLQLVEVPEPTVGERDVLVQVQAASLNLLDESRTSGPPRPLRYSRREASEARLSSAIPDLTM
jgi:NADPH:quinone reductase-like Zn-dependent oxidoreductase